MVYQEPMTALDPVLPIGLQIVESLTEHLGLTRQQARARAVDLLDLVGIPDARRRLDSYPHEFSGGMRQRAMIAIALAPQPKLLLADEPTTALDVTIQDQILKLLLRLKDDLGMSIVIVTHDLGVVAETCDRVAVMYAGRVMETGPIETVFDAPGHAYTLGLMRSVPDARYAREKLASIPGSPPEPGRLPPGCRFHPRCGFGTGACTLRAPPLMPLAPRARLGLHPCRSRAGRVDGGDMIGEALLRADDLAKHFTVRRGLLALLSGTPPLAVRALNGASLAVHRGETPGDRRGVGLRQVDLGPGPRPSDRCRRRSGRFRGRRRFAVVGP